MNSTAQRWARKALDYRQERKEIRRAVVQYQRMVSSGFVAPVPHSTARYIDEYSSAVFGRSRFAAWLLIYTAIAGEFREGWIPADLFARKIIPAVNPPYRIVAEAKTLSRRIIQSEYLPDIVYCVNGLWYDTDYTPISKDSLPQRMFVDSDRVIVKSEGTKRGDGVIILDKKGFEVSAFPSGNFVVQEYVRQHPLFREYGSDAVATLRVTTYMRNATPEIRAAYLRLGRAGASHVTAVDAIKISVVDELGTLDSRALTAEWESLTHHPDTNQPFAGVQIPGYAEAIRLCIQSHSRIPHFGVIGWDIAVDAASRPVIMEWNAVRPAISFSEATVGPCFEGLDLERLLRVDRRSSSGKFRDI